MSIITFSRENVLPVLHGVSKRNKPMIFVKDHGVYLMVSGGKEAKTIVCYADNLNPNRDLEWYNVAHSLCGGNDFAEVLEGVDVDSIINDCNWSTMNIKLTAKTLSLHLQ